ncbi:MAG TPA: nuclear transport factor 2 family protein [Steroidobacteraceae bacterium]|nr:nuclear transport factor 2 family protein [Steroidobacteraceae bacterium]
MQDSHGKPLALNLDFPLALVAGFRAGYAPDIVWTAPRRGVSWSGRDQVVANLLREAAAMQALAFTRVRRSASDDKVIDEFVARFRYAGQGIENVQLPAGAMVELERVRILTLTGNQVARESAIETWTVLGGD